MEIALLILSGILFVGLVASVTAAFFALKNAKAERVRFDELAESVFDYKMEIGRASCRERV